ncbi:hypothetical protein Bca52824_001054 [Brassica carinata]|uniref:Cytochrome P450 n=1 Tax=Brassica carinata TaxID=52824 RepID=A0A8X8B9F0_BRACI|nr:hypothetical protein Bca52824_001054 [Brassica carinata]
MPLETDVEKLQQRDYSNLKDESLLRFLVDMRGVDIDDRKILKKIMKAQAEIDTVLGEGAPTYESLKKLDRLCSSDALLNQKPCLVYNLHRSPYFWDNPQEFETGSVLRTKKSNGIEGWAGFDPSRIPGAPYPNEIISDFAFLPFGGGPRKCIETSLH